MISSKLPGQTDLTAADLPLKRISRLATLERQVRGALGRLFVTQRRVRPVAERFSRPVTSSTGLLLLQLGRLPDPGGYGGAHVCGSADPDVGMLSIGNGAQVHCSFHPRRPI